VVLRADILTVGMASEITFDQACSAVERAIAGSVRRDILDTAAASNDFGRSLSALRACLRSHVLKTGAAPIHLDRMVRACDVRTRADHFHVLHDWDGKAERVNTDTIVVDVLNFLVDNHAGQSPRAVLAILLDYYFFYLLALLSLRVWDDGRPDENFARLGRALTALQGPGGSGQMFAADAETLLLVATSHYEPDQRGYDELLERARTLANPSRRNMALGHAQSMGCHLRFGFEATYGRDASYMRADNSADYPWLCFGLAVLMEEYQRTDSGALQGADRDLVVEALLNGLSADPAPLVGGPEAFLAPCEADRAAFRDRFHAHRAELLDAFEAHRPRPGAFSPFSFFFNFSQNVLKGVVIDALLWGEPWAVSLNDLFTGLPAGDPRGPVKEKLAASLTNYARKRPDRIRGKPMPAIVYDPHAGSRVFAATMKELRAPGVIL
jgi:hypothetical protein